MSSKGWIGVDLDGTLAFYDKWQGVNVGEPIQRMADRVKAMLEAGEDVRIMTARVNPHSLGINGLTWWQVAIPIMEWCYKLFGRILPITHEKDYDMIMMYDDRAVQVVRNTGELVEDLIPALRRKET